MRRASRVIRGVGCPRCRQLAPPGEHPPRPPYGSGSRPGLGRVYATHGNATVSTTRNTSVGDRCSNPAPLLDERHATAGLLHSRADSAGAAHGLTLVPEPRPEPTASTEIPPRSPIGRLARRTVDRARTLSAGESHAAGPGPLWASVRGGRRSDRAWDLAASRRSRGGCARRPGRTASTRPARP